MGHATWFVSGVSEFQQHRRYTAILIVWKYHINLQTHMNISQRRLEMEVMPKNLISHMHRSNDVSGMNWIETGKKKKRKGKERRGGKGMGGKR